jgi:hypothetical protein
MAKVKLVILFIEVEKWIIQERTPYDVKKLTELFRPAIDMGLLEIKVESISDNDYKKISNNKI